MIKIVIIEINRYTKDKIIEIGYLTIQIYMNIDLINILRIDTKMHIIIPAK